MNKKIPIEVSARHIHLSQEDLEKLFGRGYKLKKLRQLTQSNDFAAKEVLDIQVGSKKISKVRIVGPPRAKSQVELSRTDAFNLEIKAPIRKSGDLKKTPGITLIGLQKHIVLKEGVMVPRRHIHLNPNEAKKLKLKSRDLVSVFIKGKRSVVFHNVLIRISENYRLCMHIDTDEGNAAGITKKAFGFLVSSIR